MASRKSRRVPLQSWVGILKHVRQDFGRDQVALVAGGVAFYWLLAMFPALATLVSLGALIADPAAVATAIETYGDLAPPEILDLLRGQVASIATNQQDTLTFSALLWFVTSLWVALAGIRGIVSGINVAWDLDETRGWLRSTGVALSLLGLGLGVGVVATVFIAALPAMRELGGLGVVPNVFWVVRWPLLAIAMVAYLSILYRVAPCRRAPPRAWITPGSVVATTVFMVASAGFSLYVQRFAAYHDTYGSLSNGIVLLLWFWLSAIAVLIGAEMDAEIERVVHSDKLQTVIFDRGDD